MQLSLIIIQLVLILNNLIMLSSYIFQSKSSKYITSRLRNVYNTNNNVYKSKKLSSFRIKSTSASIPSPSTSSSSSTYNHLEIEQKWQKYWDEHQTFESKRRKNHKKKYILDMFPYPSGSGLHVGHPEGYTATDIMSRYYRMLDYDVLHPMGWDAFGLPAEQHAINTGTHPAVTTYQNIATFKRQLKSLGFSYDWSRELSTTDDNYVKWTQWIFLQLYKSNLATQSEVNVNWCSALGTVLANEEIINGLSERGNHPVIRMPLRQWILKITKYADRLEDDLIGLEWPEGTLSAQKQWIGKSIGANVKFNVDLSSITTSSLPSSSSSVSSSSTIVSNNNSNDINNLDDNNIHDQLSVEVFTTRPDTLVGVTYLVLAPEHPLVDKLTIESQREDVKKYLQQITGKSDLERTSIGKERGKTGVSLGSLAKHPITNECIPIWIADYVLSNYGTGAIMAVPAHDERDYEFATLFNLPIKQVVEIIDDDTDAIKHNTLDTSNSHDNSSVTLPILGYGKIINSGDEYNGKTSIECQELIISKLEELKLGNKQITYKLRDWVFSRQRYWGEPIPIYFPIEFINDGSNEDDMKDPTKGSPHKILYDHPIAVDECDLPLKLPEMINFQPGDDPQGCLARAVDWRYFKKDDGKWYARETNTMPQWAGSCWYYLRFTDPLNQQSIMNDDNSSWLPVDLYIGGQEHAVLHLLYARFWHKVLYDIGVVNHKEPFLKLVHQGMILGSDGEKMSKSRGNVINPDDVVKEYGADALRLYEMFMGPLEAVKPWQTNQLMGVVRFRDRVYNLAKGVSNSKANNNDYNVVMSDELLREMHKTIKKVTNNIEKLSFNTAISNLMIYSNILQGYTKNDNSKLISKEAVETLLLLLSPFAPHVAEECWLLLGYQTSISNVKWPEYDENLCKEIMTTIVIQVNGKYRAKLELTNDVKEDEVVEEALKQSSVTKYTDGLNIKKTIYVPGKILNIVV